MRADLSTIPDGLVEVVELSNEPAIKFSSPSRLESLALINSSKRRFGGGRPSPEMWIYDIRKSLDSNYHGYQRKF